MKRIIILHIFLLISVVALAQQDPLFSQYTFNKLLVNPAYAGSSDGLNITLVNRAQWVNIEGAPNTLTISAHAAGKKNKVGLGFYLNRDMLGPTVNNSFMAKYTPKFTSGVIFLIFDGSNK